MKAHASQNANQQGKRTRKMTKFFINLSNPHLIQISASPKYSLDIIREYTDDIHGKVYVVNDGNCTETMYCDPEMHDPSYPCVGILFSNRVSERRGDDLALCVWLPLKADSPKAKQQILEILDNYIAPKAHRYQQLLDTIMDEKIIRMN